MKKLKHMLGAEKGKEVLIIGAGGSISKYRSSILKFIKQSGVSTIGVNNMVDLVVPKYHVWTNSRRYRKFRSCINTSSILMMGANLNRVSKRHRSLKDVRLKYVDQLGIPINYRRGRIEGHFRTAGCLSIMIAHIMEAKSIYIVGMDGYTYRSKKELQAGHGQHFYGTGYTDGSSWRGCVAKDRLVYKSLRMLRKHGIQFSILTPTVFKRFYDGSII